MTNSIKANLLKDRRHKKSLLNLRLKNDYKTSVYNIEKKLPEILFLSSYPPRQCGIATYCQDLVKVLSDKFGASFSLKICALESKNDKFTYGDEVTHVLDTSEPKAYTRLANRINANDQISMVLVQHEFGLFADHDEDFRQFLNHVTKPVIVVFHTVLPRPDNAFRLKVQQIAAACRSVIVMTDNAAQILTEDYRVEQKKIAVIPHGTHLVPHLDKDMLKEKHGLTGRKVLSTFGLLGSGKSIETTLEALPAIIKKNPEAIFLVIGKTHPSIVKHDGEAYRNMLTERIKALELEQHVRFVNYYLTLPELLEYLQLTDIYLFTSKDPNQAVSGTFSYALSCGCPIISTPIPHAMELLNKDTRFIFDFGNSKQLGESVNRLFADDELRKNTSIDVLHRIVSTAWENAAIKHAILFEDIAGDEIALKYSLPPVNLDHIKKMTTDFGMIQFSQINQPDIESGYTIDDNARAMIALCQYFKLTNDKSVLPYIHKYLDFIAYCMQPSGQFLNYVDADKNFTAQNDEVNLDDSNGRAVWALGYLVSLGSLLPASMTSKSAALIRQAMPHIKTIHSTRSLAFFIKGLYLYNRLKQNKATVEMIKTLADRMVQMYRHESGPKWEWFESYLTYANSVLPEAMLYAYKVTGEQLYKDIAKASFDFLLSHTFKNDAIKVVSNVGWMNKGEIASPFGEQPIDVAYTILTLGKFYDVFRNNDYLVKMTHAFNWFLGNNHLRQIIYNPCTGGCFDGLEETHVNLNQGAESTVSYLMARLTVEKYKYLGRTDMIRAQVAEKGVPERSY